MFQSIYENVSTQTTLAISIKTLLLCVAVGLLIGLLITGAYFIITPKRGRSASFTLSMVILPAIVGVVILLIGGNLARAFSMAGIFTIVRFRSIPGDAKDISFVFLTMATGLAVGLGYLTLGVVVAVLISIAIILVSKTGVGIPKQKEKSLRITVPEDLNYQGIFDEVFSKYTSFCEMQRVKTSNMGTLFELTYDIILKDAAQEKELIDALRCRNGNLPIALSVKEGKDQQL